MSIAGIGIDAGSTTCKLVAVDAAGEIVTSVLEPAHPRIESQVETMLEGVRSRTGATNGVPCVATGYGRKLVVCADRQVTEITCHARGVFRGLQRSATLIDIGGQDSKVIRIGDDGRPVDFVMNDKCAAGTGRFLEHTAGRLGVEIGALGDRALAGLAEEQITSTCTVFAESEIISLIARGAGVDAILRGLHRSLVGRIAAMVRSIGWTPPLILSGGVALNDGVRVMIGEALGETVTVPDAPQLTGAYGAALLALEIE
ncbi:MAG: acyl-CoA dehydratase activase [Actinomycetota bacterium]